MKRSMKAFVAVAVAMDSYTATMTGEDREWALTISEHGNLFIEGTSLGFDDFMYSPCFCSGDCLIKKYKSFPRVMDMYYDYIEWLDSHT